MQPEQTILKNGPFICYMQTNKRYLMFAKLNTLT